jgi:radical SAM superfamily enzyme YgiQ (UPF0313 family)
MVFAGSPEVTINESVIRDIAAIIGDSEIIGISSMSRGSSRAKTLIEGLRPLGRLIVWGGIHPTLFPEDCTGHADLVCRGEGEEFMLDVAERVSSGRELGDIPNGACLINGHTIRNDLRPLITDLDALPLLDFAFENEYILKPDGTLVPNTEMKNKIVVLFSGSRGCNNNCTYCSNSELKSIYRGKGHYVRKMSIPRFVDAARYYHQLFPRATHFYFTDEDFFARPVDEMREFAETYPDQVGLPFECMASPRQITEEKVALAARAGMFQIDVGLESGSQRVRHEIFDRFIKDTVQIEAAIAINRHVQVTAMYFIILGNPYEQQQDLIDGIKLLEQLPPPYSLRAYNLVFIPGTKLFKRAVQDGIIRDVADSGFELDFLAGFDHRTHAWKKKNIFLNSLISMMHGKTTRWRMGFLPRMVIPVLVHPRLVDFCDRHSRISEMNVGLANLRLKMLKRVPSPLGPVMRYTSKLRNKNVRSPRF